MKMIPTWQQTNQLRSTISITVFLIRRMISSPRRCLINQWVVKNPTLLKSQTKNSFPISTMASIINPLTAETIPAPRVFSAPTIPFYPRPRDSALFPKITTKEASRMIHLLERTNDTLTVTAMMSPTLVVLMLRNRMSR